MLVVKRALKQLKPLEYFRRIHFHRIPATVIHKRGRDVIKDPWFNKGTAFNQVEKDRLGVLFNNNARNLI
jgi:hypothetical protein